jgi:ubiquinone/menaquinone biosynthesis C-methylase UbiE
MCANECGFVLAGAHVYPFERASFDAAFSRFGVMFFTDPVVALVNIRRSLSRMLASPSSAGEHR